MPSFYGNFGAGVQDYSQGGVIPGFGSAQGLMALREQNPMLWNSLWSTQSINQATPAPAPVQAVQADKYTAPTRPNITGPLETDLQNMLTDPGLSKVDIESMVQRGNDTLNGQKAGAARDLQQRAIASGFGRSGAMQQGLQNLDTQFATQRAGNRRDIELSAAQDAENREQAAVSLANEYMNSLSGNNRGDASMQHQWDQDALDATHWNQQWDNQMSQQALANSQKYPGLFPGMQNKATWTKPAVSITHKPGSGLAPTTQVPGLNTSQMFGIGGDNQADSTLANTASPFRSSSYGQLLSFPVKTRVKAPGF